MKKSFLCFVIYLLSLEAAYSSTILHGKVGVLSFPESVWWDQWERYRSKLIKNKEINLEWYLRGELGSEQQLLSGVRRNRINIISISSQGMSSLIPASGVLQIPYIFESLEQADFVLDHFVSEPIRKLFSKRGLEVMHFTEVGWNVLYTTNELVKEPSDLKGKTIRISPSIILQSFIESIRSDYAILEVGDLIPALQTGLVQGGLTNVVFVHNAVYSHVCCVTRLKAIYEIGVNLANKKWLDSASDKQRKFLIDSYDALDKARVDVRNYVDNVVKKGPKRGLNYYSLNPDQIKNWKAASKTATKQILDSTGSEGIELFEIIKLGKNAYKNR